MRASIPQNDEKLSVSVAPTLSFCVRWARLCLCGCGACGIDGSLFKGEVYSVRYVEHNFTVVHRLDGAVQTSNSDHGLTNRERIAEVVDFLLFLLLRTNHEEIHHCAEEHKHQNSGQH